MPNRPNPDPDPRYGGPQAHSLKVFSLDVDEADSIEEILSRWETYVVSRHVDHRVRHGGHKGPCPHLECRVETLEDRCSADAMAFAALLNRLSLMEIAVDEQMGEG